MTASELADQLVAVPPYAQLYLYAEGAQVVLQAEWPDPDDASPSRVLLRAPIHLQLGAAATP